MRVFFLLLLVQRIIADVESSLKDQISFSLPSYACYRLMGVDIDVGCSTGQDGVTGLLYSVNNAGDITAFTSLDSSKARAVVMPISLLTAANIATLSAASHFGGIIVRDDTIPADFSPDEIDLPYGSATPYAWNPVGRSLLYTRFNFPIVALPNDQVSSIVQLAASNKAKGYNSFPQHAVHFFYYMGPSNLRSAQCLSDSSCLPLGGQSVWASLGAIVNDTAMDGRLLSDSRKLSTEPHQAVPIALHARKQQAKQSQMKPHIPTERRLGEVIGRSDSEFVMAVAQIDSDGLFHDIAYGADSAISGVVALLAAADALGKSDANTLPKKILFGAFQGEQFGRIGSRRWLQEVTSFSCNNVVAANESTTGRAFCASPLRTNLDFSLIDPSKITHVVGVDQLGTVAASPFYVHEQPCTSGTSYIADVLQALQGTITVQPATNAQIPPSAASAFTGTSGGMCADVGILAGYDTSYTSKYFHSQFDTADNVDGDRITSAANLLAQGLYAIATGIADPAAAAAAVPGSLAVNATLVSTLLDCILVNPQCVYFQQVLGVSAAAMRSIAPSTALSLYVSVYVQPYVINGNGYVIQPSLLEAVIRNSLAVATATQSNASPACSTKACQQQYGAEFECIMNRCIVATAYYHDALSPALSSPSYGVYNIDNSAVTDSDPVWTEPYWSTRIGTRVYLVESEAVDIAVLVIGIVLVLAAIPGTWKLVSYLDTHYKVP